MNRVPNDELVDLINDLCSRHGRPHLSLDSSREELIRFLAFYDPNGCWTDQDNQREGMPPLTLPGAWEMLAYVLLET